MKDARLVWASEMNLDWFLFCLNWFMTNNPNRSTRIISRLLGSEQHRPKELLLWAPKFSLHFFWLLEPFRIFVSRLLQALCCLFTSGLHWFMFKCIFFFLFNFLFAQLPRWLIRLLKNRFQKPYLFHAPLTANILRLSQKATVFVEVAMVQTHLHWCSLPCEILPSKRLQGWAGEHAMHLEAGVSAKPSDSLWNRDDLEKTVSNRN